MLAVLTFAAAYALIAALYAINHHHNLGTTLFDLSIYDNIFYQTIHGKPLGTTLIAGGYHTAAHFDPILVLLSPLYLLHPRAELLLALQSVWLASMAIPLYLLGRRLLGQPWAAAAIACAALLHPAVHGANFYDFHSLTLVPPLFIWAFYFLETGSKRGYWAMLSLLLLTREDVALLTVFLGVYAILRGRSKQLGLMTISVSLIYFVAVRAFIMSAAGDDAHSYAYYYSDLVPEGGGPMSLVVSLFKSPLFAIRHVFSPAKLQFLATLFVPVLFLPLLAKRGAILMLYGLAVILLASRDALYSVHFQYTSILYPAMFVLVPVALAELHGMWPFRRLAPDPPRLRRVASVGVLVATALVSIKFGGLVPNDTFRSGFGPFQPYMTEASAARYRWVEKVTNDIPDDASVAASRHMGPHVSNRYAIYRFPRNGWGSDFVFVDRDELKDWEKANLASLTNSGAYAVVAARGDRYFVLQRDPSNPLPERMTQQGGEHER